MYYTVCTTLQYIQEESSWDQYENIFSLFRKKLSSGQKFSSLRKIVELIQKQNCTVNKSVEHIQEENWHIQDIYLAHSEMKWVPS